MVDELRQVNSLINEGRDSCAYYLEHEILCLFFPPFFCHGHLWMSCETSAWYDVPKFQTLRSSQVICINHIVQFRPDELLSSVTCQLFLSKVGGWKGE